MTDAAPPPEPVEQVAEVAAKVARRIGGPGWLIIVSVTLVAIVALFLGVVRYGVITPQGRAFLEARTSGLKLGRIGTLKIEGLSGDIWRDFGVRRLTISDEKGVWLEGADLHVVIVAGNRNHLNLRAERLYRAYRFRARESGQAKVHQHPPGMILAAAQIRFQQRDARLGVRASLDAQLGKTGAQRIGERDADHRMVVDDQQGRQGSHRPEL